MSELDWTDDQNDDTTEANTADRTDRRQQLAQALARGGMDGVQVLSLESANRALTPKRREIIETLRVKDVDSVRDLARRLDRDKGQVSRDLGVLAEHGIISYDEDGRAKRPYLTQEHLIVEPL
jgi:predicted transcriptional regulator